MSIPVDPDDSASDYGIIARHRKTTSSLQVTCTISGVFRILAGKESSVRVWTAAQGKLVKRERSQKTGGECISEVSVILTEKKRAPGTHSKTAGKGLRKDDWLKGE